MASEQTTTHDAAPAASMPARYAVRRLTLTDFRSYDALRLDLDAGMLVFAGANGAGKTNLLEAVSMLVPGRGLRAARLGDLASSKNGGEWAVAARIEGPAGPADVGTGWQGGDGQDADAEDGDDADGSGFSGGSQRRAVRIDGQPAKSQAELAGVMGAHWLTPQMDRLFQEGASARRRFLDRMAFGWDPAHAGRVAAYEQAMRERMKLLRGQRDDRRAADPAWLAALEETMASKGIAVSAARIDMTARLAHGARDGFGPFPGAEVALQGDVEAWLAEGPALAAEDRFRDALARARMDDARIGRTTCGPQRSDLVVHHRPKAQPAGLCSTGEQKALLIALVLANARARALEDGAQPVLLLDEIAAHLDEARRNALFDALSEIGAQVWLTGTDAELFHPLAGRAQFFAVAEGGSVVETRL
jgi:DNA replication and repair protein RecF